MLAAGDSGNFLVTPNVGVMIWTLIAFGLTMYLLYKLAFPRIGEALDKRQRAIEESIDASERTKREADQLLAEYRERLGGAPERGGEIGTAARKGPGGTAEGSTQQARGQRE